MSSSRVKPIKDPEFKKGEAVAFPEKMKMRALLPCEGSMPNYVKLKPLDNKTTDAKVKGMKGITGEGFLVDCLKISDQVLDSIDSIDDHKGFTIGKGDNKFYCGHTIQRIGKGCYARIGDGKCIFSTNPPIKRGAKTTFNFDRTRQLAIKVGNKVGKDWVVIVAGNGCIFMDTGSYASFHMPIYVVEQTGDYYKVSTSNRILLLGTGHHLLLYTKQVPILYVRKHTVTHEKSIPLSELKGAPQKSVDSKAKTSEPLKSKEEPKKEPIITVDEVVKPKSKEKTETIGPVVPPPPKVIDDSAPKEVKEIKGLSPTSPPPKPSPKVRQQSVSIPVPTRHRPTPVPEVPEEPTNWKRIGLLIGISLLALLLLFLLCRFLFGGNSQSSGTTTGTTTRTTHLQKPGSGKKFCRICNYF